VLQLDYRFRLQQNTTNIMKIARNPIIPEVAKKQAIVIGNLKEHKTLLSSIFLL